MEFQIDDRVRIALRFLNTGDSATLQALLDRMSQEGLSGLEREGRVRRSPEDPSFYVVHVTPQLRLLCSWQGTCGDPARCPGSLVAEDVVNRDFLLKYFAPAVR
jgi:hypothetical protein